MSIRDRVGRHTRSGQNCADDQKTVIDLLNLEAAGRACSPSDRPRSVPNPSERCAHYLWRDVRRRR
jgi:hypothetical protein